MEIFGFVCSALCKGKAEAQGVELPIYEHQKSVAEAKRWRKTGLVAGSMAAVVLAILGLWFYYAWFASMPKKVFSVRFEAPGYSGQCRLLAGNQLVFLHGGTLARHDLKTKKAVWSRELIDRKKLQEQAALAVEQETKAKITARDTGKEVDMWIIPTVPEALRVLESSAQAELQLHVFNENIWVASSDKLVRYDWQTGEPAKDTTLGEHFGRCVPGGNELLLISERESGHHITHFDLTSGEMRTEELAAPITPALAGAAGKTSSPGTKPRKGPGGQTVPALTAKQTQAMAAARNGGQPGKPLNPAAVANRVQNLPLPSRAALPAVLAADANQQRLQAEMRGETEREPGLNAAAFRPDTSEHIELVRDGSRFIQLSVKLVESKIVTRQAMKAPPGKSALDGDVNASSTAAVANEILNEMQRDRGADVVKEDVSRYQVKISRPGEKDTGQWSGEVIGPPEFFPLKTVDVLAAGKAVWVFDKSNKLLWGTNLVYGLAGGHRDLSSGETPPYGEGPVVERGDTLYFFDAGVLGALDLATGNARWRLPSVGVCGLQFDEQGNLYVNTSNQSADILRYPNQIDVTEKTWQVVLKVNARTGAALWRAEKEGLVSYVSGKYIYTTVSHQGDDDGGLGNIKLGFEIPPHIRIKRLDPSNGHVLWEHYEMRSPLDMHFDKNLIQLLFRKEMEVLSFFTL